MANRIINTTDTIEVLRVTFNGMAVDVGDITDLNVPFVGTPTDLVEAVNSKATASDLEDVKDEIQVIIDNIDHTEYETVIKSESDDADTLAEAVLQAGTYTDIQMLTASGATGGGDESIFFINETTLDNDYTIPDNYNAMTAGPIAQNADVIIPEGSSWIIV